MNDITSHSENVSVSTSRTSNYNGIDLIKFLCAFMVFIIHIPPFQGEVSRLAGYVNFGLQNYICRLAVPFYFVASGFFLFRKMPLYDLNTEVVKQYCFKILRLVGIWHVLLFAGKTTHLWYLGATVIAVTLLSLCLYFRIRIRYICVSACLLYVIGLLGDAYYGVMAPLEKFAIFRYISKGYDFAFSTTRNGVFMGFIFVLMGAGFSCHRIQLKQRTALLGFAVSMLCLFAEVYLLNHNRIPIDYNMYIFLVPATFFLFSFAYTVQLKDHAIYKCLRNVGAWMYFIHLLIDAFVSLAIRLIDTHMDLPLWQYQFMFSLLFTVLLAIFLAWLSGRDKFKWINLCLS